MKMKIGNDLTPPKAVKKMNEVVAGIRCLKYIDENRMPGEYEYEHWIYEGAATVDDYPIDGSVVSPIYDTEWNMQNILITLPDGRDLLIPHAPLTAGFGPFNDGRGTWIFTEDWRNTSTINDATANSVAAEETWRNIKALFGSSERVVHPEGNLTLR